ncbi:mitogen-activated protein kinase tyrosine protein phosphatase sdp1 [Stylosanthes scabra]|uniref:Mitogen-activated protein kinase tyrosine protein phosphatase sdp1 n=1 Tax=Stylosanthes scabra TaxID=79078 RepID=A0ABU6SIG1_9FABA|nr:mitogen-activated protein kinase tyrosine protein phosphatase sdp1 [Stylosanthes scabra]
MRRLKRSAERAASATHGLSSTNRFNASRRIPSWNCIARENSTGSLEDLTDVASSSMPQGVSCSNGGNGKNWKTLRSAHDGHDSDSESVDLSLNTWTRSGGPLMRTTSANKFIDFICNLDADSELNKGLMSHSNPHDFQYHSPRNTPPDWSFDNVESSDQKEQICNRFVNSSSIVVNEGDLLQPERVQNGFLFNIVKKEELAHSNRCHDLENYSNEAAESVQVEIESPEKDMDAASSSSESGDDDSLAATRSLT